MQNTNTTPLTNIKNNNTTKRSHVCKT